MGGALVSTALAALVVSAIVVNWLRSRGGAPQEQCAAVIRGSWLSVGITFASLFVLPLVSRDQEHSATVLATGLVLFAVEAVVALAVMTLGRFAGDHATWRGARAERWLETKAAARMVWSRGLRG